MKVNWTFGLNPFRQKGLTLMELLIVIGIIAVLAGIIWVVFAPARRKAQLTHCINNFRQLYLALEEYRHDWDGLDVEVAQNFDELALPITPYIVTGDWPFQKVIWVWGTQELWYCPATIYRKKLYGGVSLDYEYRPIIRWGLYLPPPPPDAPESVQESYREMLEMTRRAVAELEQEFRYRKGDFVVLYHQAHAPMEVGFICDFLFLRLNGQIQIKYRVKEEPQKW